MTPDIEGARKVAERLHVIAGQYDEYDHHGETEIAAATALTALITEVERLTAWKEAVEKAEVVAYLRNDGMKAMPADEKEAWIEAGHPDISEPYALPLIARPSKEPQA